MNNIGVRLHDVDGKNLEEKIILAHQQGFKCIHLAVNKVEKEFQLSWFTQEYADKLNHILKENEMELAILGCYKNLADPRKDKLNEIKEQYYRHIDFASMMKQGIVGTETGCPNEEYQWDENTHTEESVQLFIENLKPIVEYAQKKGVILAIEPVYKHIVHSAKIARQILDEIDSPALKIIFDPVNLLSKDNIKNQVELLKEAIYLLGKDIVAIHIKDYQVDREELKAIRCGLGEMSYDSVAQFILEKGNIPITLENTCSDNAEEARVFLQDEINKKAPR